jgi:hypothetical protein
MKLLKKITLTITGLALIAGLNNCSKDRVAKPSLNAYNTPDKFQNSNKQQEQVYIINRNGTCPLTCQQGTTICMDSSALADANGVTATYPFTLRVLELYSAKDMILYNVPNLSGSRQLTSGGELRIRSFIGNNELAIKAGQNYAVTTKTIASADPSMQIYYGIPAATMVNWAGASPAGAGQIIATATNYQLKVPQTGWVAPCHPVSYAVGTATVSFSSDKDDLTNVAKFLYFDKLKSVMQVYGNTSNDAPVGEHAIVICYAADASGKMFYYTQALTIGSSNTINVTMQSATDVDLLTFLGTL